MTWGVRGRSEQSPVGLGLNPWDVFHQGLPERSALSFGTIVILAAAAVLLLWIPLRQRPGFVALANIVVVGLAVDASLAVLPEITSLPLRWALLIAVTIGQLVHVFLPLFTVKADTAREPAAVNP